MNSWLPSSDPANSKTLSNVDLSWLPNYNDTTFPNHSNDSNHQHLHNEFDDSWLPTYNDTNTNTKSVDSIPSRKTDKDSDDSWLPSAPIVKNNNKIRDVATVATVETVATVSGNQQIQNSKVLKRKSESSGHVSPSISECSVETDSLGGVSTLLRRWKDAETKNSNRNSKPLSCNNNKNDNSNHTGLFSKASDGSGRSASASTTDDSFIDSGSSKSSFSMPVFRGTNSLKVDDVEEKSNKLSKENICFSRVIGKPRLIRGRQAFLDFLSLAEQDKRRELEWLMQRKPVSKFPHRGRIQALLRVKIIRIKAENQKGAKNHKHSVSKTMKNIWDKFSTGVKQGAAAAKRVNNIEGVKKNNNISPECSVDCSPDRELTVTTTASTAANSQELVSATTSHQSAQDVELTVTTAATPAANSQELVSATVSHQSAQEAKVGVENCHHWINECSQTQSDWDDDEEEEEGDEYYNYNYNWISDIARPRSDWDCMRQQRYQEMLHIYSYNQDMQQLLERKSVSGFLSSDRRKLLDQLMVSRAQGVSITESRKDEEKYEEDEFINDQRSWNPNQPNAIYDANQMASPSPSPSSWPNPYLQNNNNHTSIEMELIYDLRRYVEQIHQEVMELRRAVTSCVNMQVKNQHQSIQKKSSESEQVSTTRNCCVCYAVQVDSFLYRCGHMCTCYDCGLELQCTSGKCPICKDTIMDVVRACAYGESLVALP